jgi:hypothetical protein
LHRILTLLFCRDKDSGAANGAAHTNGHAPSNGAINGGFKGSGPSAGTGDAFADMLDLILVGKYRGGDVWGPELETQLCYELKTFLLAGHETSASMLTLSLLEAAHDPAIAARIVQEADAVLGPPGNCKVGFHSKLLGGMKCVCLCSL